MSKTPCPCGSNQSYDRCCSRFIENGELPNTPEELMRSRYTAYASANIDYIEKTMCDKAAVGFNAEQAKQWATHSEWLGLTVKQSSMDGDKGFVEFFARHTIGKQAQHIHELSEFHKIDEQWFYVDGEQPKIQRNDLCPCGSGKKYKKCCLL